jgi:peptidylprolyl isomerase
MACLMAKTGQLHSIEASPDTLPLRSNLELIQPMKHSYLILMVAAGALAASAQTPAKPATASATAAKPAVTAAAKPAVAGLAKLPPGIPPVRGVHKTAFSLTYQEIKIGDGPVAEPGKLYKVLYTGWRAADGVKFDSSDDHRQPLKDKDGKPVVGPDGKPKLDVAQPMPFPQGMGRLIPGFDQGFGGMKVHGKRRLFIPWQLAYGIRAMPDHGTDHPGIPAKSDLIFDVELVSVEEMPSMPMNHPGMGSAPGMGHGPMPPNHPQITTPGQPAVPVAPGKPAAAPAAAPVTAPAVPAATAPKAAPQAPAPVTPAVPMAPATAPAAPQSK